MIYEKPDGAIEVAISGCCCPPGERRGGQHTNSSTEWIRVIRGVFPSEWENVRDLPVSRSSLRTYIMAARSVSELTDAMAAELVEWLRSKGEADQAEHFAICQARFKYTGRNPDVLWVHRRLYSFLLAAADRHLSCCVIQRRPGCYYLNGVRVNQVNDDSLGVMPLTYVEIPF